MASSLITVALAGAGEVAQAQEATMPPAVGGVRIVAFADARLRFEDVDAASRGEASALTLRVRPGLEAELDDQTTALFELETTADLWDRSAPDALSRRLIPDRSVIQINRAQLSRDLGAARFTAGRQRIELADERVVGSAGFRQNEQTFDAVRMTTEPAHGLTLDVGYAWAVNQFNATNAAPARFNGRLVFANLEAQAPFGRVNLFHTDMDLEGNRHVRQNPLIRNRTTGVGLAGVGRRDGVEIEWRADFARQTGEGESADYRVDYSRLRLKVDADAFVLVANRERLGGDGRRAFQTPLGSNHAFLGSAEVFVVAPPSGVEDRSLEGVARFAAIGPVRAISVSVRRHIFDGGLGAGRLGTEWDLLISGQWRGYRLSAERARYEADAFGVDTSRTWLTVSRNF